MVATNLKFVGHGADAVVVHLMPVSVRVQERMQRGIRMRL